MQSVPTEAEFNSLALSVSKIADRVTTAEGKITALEGRVTKLETATPTPTPTPTPTGEYPLTINQNTKDGKWRCKYIGSGNVFATDSPLGFHLIPKAATNYTNDSSGVGYETYACEVLSNTVYTNFTLDFDATCIKRLRTGYSKYGVNQQGPQPWETWWIFFRFTDEDPKSNHHYYFLLRPDHPEFGKKDNAPGDTTVEQQIYLPRVSELPQQEVGKKNHVTVNTVGNRFVITVDGVKVIDYTDNAIKDPTKMAKGLVGFYCEDSEVKIENIKIV